MNSKKIMKIMANQNLSMYKLSQTANIGYATLYDILNGKCKSPRIDTITKIAKALNEKIENLI